MSKTECNHGVDLSEHCPKCAGETEPLPFGTEDLPPNPHEAKLAVPRPQEPAGGLAGSSGGSEGAELSQPVKFAVMDREQVQLLKDTIMPGATDQEFQFFAEVCNRTKLDPFRKEIHPVKRRVKHDGQWVERWAFQCGIDGYRKRAAATGHYAGSEIESSPETGDHPEFSKATVYRAVGGQRVPFEAVARWNEYVQTDRNGSPVAMWSRMPYNMLEKCAEAKALRKAFPDEFSGLYVEEELQAIPEREAPQLVDEEKADKIRERVDQIQDEADKHRFWDVWLKIPSRDVTEIQAGGPKGYNQVMEALRRIIAKQEGGEE